MRRLTVFVIVAAASAALAQSDRTTAVQARPRSTDLIADPHRPLATLPPAKMTWYHTNRAPAVGNGRLYQGRVFTSDPRPEIDWPGPGPERYGAANDDASIIYARVGRAVVAFSPWMNYEQVDAGRVDVRDHCGRAVDALTRRPTGVTQGFSSQTARRVEADLGHARNTWLREQGFVGGVRTFRNPVAAGDTTAESAPEPAGWFRRPPELPRTRSTEQVRLSLPPGIDPATAAILRAQSGQDAADELACRGQ